MGNKEWDNYLREILGDFKSENGPADWETVARQFDAENITTSNTESLEDEALKEKLTNYTPASQVKGWDRIESALDATETEFDHQVRARIHAFHPPKDPHSWQAFLSSFSKHKILRAKLIVVKLFESAAILLLLITVLHMGHTGRLPLISTDEQELAQAETNQSKSLNKPDHNRQTDHKRDLSAAVEIATKDIAQAIATLSVEKKSKAKDRTTIYSSKEKWLSAADVKTETVSGEFEILNSSQDISESDFINLSGSTHTSSEVKQMFGVSEIHASISADNTFMDDESQTTFPDIKESYITESLSPLTTNIQVQKKNLILVPVFVATAKKPIFEFGMLVQADYNQLKLPGDRLYNNGGQVVFPLQGLTSPGYGAGFTLAVGHPLWAFETGLIYNAKSFRPGREITIGGASDNSKVEFDAIHMQVISIPLQFRYRFEPKGRLKAYALAGFGLHLITQSDIDVMVEYNFPSLNPGENPKNNPSLARTIRETERVSDDFREKAPFSSQSYISANLGLGIEYAIAEHKTLFLQTAYQYQIPNLRFSNHNGKHLLSVSLQAGVRTPLGV